MNISEKIEMYKNKKAFVDGISKVFETNFVGASVSSVDYEVYKKDFDVVIDGTEEIRTGYAEYVIVNYLGGGKSVKQVNGNSNTANFRAIGTMLDGGYYAEMKEYSELTEEGWELIPLKPETNILDDLLAKPMRHISDVRRCFNYCTDGNDIERVIDLIPSCFGTFEVEYGEDGETFLITNNYEENGDYLTEEAEYEFYTTPI
jgi:hypothetical protein